MSISNIHSTIDYVDLINNQANQSSLNPVEEKRNVKYDNNNSNKVIKKTLNRAREFKIKTK